MLILPGEIHHLRHFGLGYLVSIHPTDADPAPMHVQHDAGRLLAALREKTLKDVNHKLHRSVIVVPHQDLVHRRLLRLRLGPDDDARPRSFPAASSVVAHLLSEPWPSWWR